MLVFHTMNISQRFSFVAGYLFCFRILAITNSAAKNILMSFGSVMYIPGSVIAVSLAIHMFSFCGYSQFIFVPVYTSIRNV